MKVYLYENENLLSRTALEDCIRAWIHLSIGEREQEKSDDVIYLEKHRKLSELPNGWAMDFTLRRTSGPGRSRKGGSTEDFDLEKDEGFGEQTAVVYDSETNFVAVQYNHFGPRVGAIENYLNSFKSIDGGGHFRWNPKLHKNTEAQLMNSVVQKKLEFKVLLDGLTDAAHEQGVGMNEVLKLGGQTNAAEISVTLSLGRGARSKSLDAIRFVRDLLKYGKIVKKLQAKVINSDQEHEILDFIGGTVFAEVPVKNLTKTEGKRYTFGSRIAAINKEMAKWKSQ